MRVLAPILSFYLAFLCIIAFPGLATAAKRQCAKVVDNAPDPQSLRNLALAESRADVYLKREFGSDPNKALRLAVSSSGDKGLIELMEYLLKEDFEVGIDMPEEKRLVMLKDPAFKNFFETGLTTNFGPSQGIRAAVESSMLGRRVQEYFDSSHSQKPKYGYLRPSPNTRLQGKVISPVPTAYGNDTWIFKNSAISPFTTFFLGDSLNRAGEFGVSGFDTWKTSDQKKPQKWSQIFLPWKHLGFLILGMHKSVPETEELSVRNAVNWYSEGTTTSSIGAPPHELKYDLYITQQTYAEAEIWRPDLSLDHVAAFEFRKIPPRGNFLKMLLGRGIEIRDGRKWPAHVWKPKEKGRG